MDYFGFGTSAHSFINNKRSWNFSSLKMYIENIERLGIAVAGSETISPEKALNEFVMLELRSSGLNIKEFGNLFGDSWLKEKYPYFELLKKNDFVQISNGLIKLTKKGYAICDEILKELL
jgi:oxygen-independent coproporphyrinogen-3 oxidase